MVDLLCLVGFLLGLLEFLCLNLTCFVGVFCGCLLDLDIWIGVWVLPGLLV